MTDICQNERQRSCQNGYRNMSQVLEKIGAGERNRTVVISLEGCRSTIELHPQGHKPERSGRDIDKACGTQIELAHTCVTFATGTPEVRFVFTNYTL